MDGKDVDFFKILHIDVEVVGKDVERPETAKVVAARSARKQC